VLEVYANPFVVDYKSPKDPVTLADRRANELICRRLNERFPGVPVVAEESEPKSFVGFQAAERVFFVDPVDGTREFVARNGEFVIMIGLLVGARAEAGVVLAPAMGTTWYGSLSAGAFELAPDGTTHTLHVSVVDDLSRARVVASRSHRNTALELALAALDAGKLLTLGSAGLKGAAVARDLADAYVAPHYAGQRWDVCAVDALVSAAGGRVTNARGVAIDYRADELHNDQGVVASNGRIHDAIIARLAEHLALLPQSLAGADHDRQG
jgi:3'(2'), 5'-bisphosphate nucleotidase